MLTEMHMDDYATLLQQVADWLPHSLVVYHWLKIACTKMAPVLEGARVYVDRWPMPRLVCATDPVIYEGLPSYFLSFAMSQYPDENQPEALELFSGFLGRLDKALNLTENAHGICTLSLPYDVSQGLYGGYFNRRGCAVKILDSYMYWVPQELRNNLQQEQVPLPLGYHFDTLRVDEAEFVDATWPHRWMGSLPLNTRKVRYMPNVCVRDQETGSVCSFEIMHSEFGMINHLYTAPEYRRYGLARSVEMRQMQNAARADMIPYKMVVADNLPAMKMTTKIPYWQLYGRYPFVEIFTAKARQALSEYECIEI